MRCHRILPCMVPATAFPPFISIRFQLPFICKFCNRSLLVAFLSVRRRVIRRGATHSDHPSVHSVCFRFNIACWYETRYGPGVYALDAKSALSDHAGQYRGLTVSMPFDLLFPWGWNVPDV